MAIKQEIPAKRQDPRYLTRIAIFYGPYQKKILTNYSINLSTGGIFVETSMILPEDTNLTVKFKLPNTDTMIVVKARVAWVNSPESLKKATLPVGMGLHFLDLSAEDMCAIRTYLDKGAFVPTG